METCPPIELSDDESSNKMPPPAALPAPKAAKENKEKKTRSTRSKQPRRRVITLQNVVDGFLLIFFIFVAKTD